MCAMFVGAAAGAVLVLRAGVPAVLAGVCVVLAVSIAVELRAVKKSSNCEGTRTRGRELGMSSVEFRCYTSQ